MIYRGFKVMICQGFQVVIGKGFKFMICRVFKILILGVYIMQRMHSAHTRGAYNATDAQCAHYIMQRHTYMHSAAARIHTCLGFRFWGLGFGV